MPNKNKSKSKAAQHLRNIISFRVSDQELDLLERLRGDRNTKLSTVLRQLLKLVIDNQPEPARQRSYRANSGLKSVHA